MGWHNRLMFQNYLMSSTPMYCNIEVTDKAHVVYTVFDIMLRCTILQYVEDQLFTGTGNALTHVHVQRGRSLFLERYVILVKLSTFFYFHIGWFLICGKLHRSIEVYKKRKIAKFLLIVFYSDCHQSQNNANFL